VSSTELNVQVAEPPAPELVDRLGGLYKLWDRDHARGDWFRDLSDRLSVRCPESIDRFYHVPYESQIAAALDVSRSATFNGLGVIHRVFAHPTQRRLGLSRKLIDAARSDFKDSRGRLLILAAPEAGAARRFYSDLGFSEIVRARDGEILYGWAARGRHVREAALRFLKHDPVTWRPAHKGDWPGLLLWSSLPGGQPGAVPDTLLDVEWIGAFDSLGGETPAFGLDVGESRHGYIVAIRTTGSPPAFLAGLPQHEG
jgi:GNAT superfamily N-acetyltransferase